MLILLSMKLACSSNPRGCQAQREKSWLSEELEMRNKAFQEDRARDCQEMDELQRICCAEAERAPPLRIDEKSFYSESAYGSDSGIARQGKFLD